MSNPVPQLRSAAPSTADVPVERARLTVVPRRRTRAARMPFVALVSLVLLGGVVGLLLFNTSMQQASFAATALEGRADTLAARQQTLQMDLDRLRDPQRIATAAQKLGMVQAGNPAFLRLGSGKVSGVPSTGDPAQPLRINPLPPKKPAAISPRTQVVWVDPAPAGSGDGSGDTGGGGAGNSGPDDRKNQTHQQSQQPQQSQQSRQTQQTQQTRR